MDCWHLRAPLHYLTVIDIVIGRNFDFMHVDGEKDGGGDEDGWLISH